MLTSREANLDKLARLHELFFRIGQEIRPTTVQAEFFLELSQLRAALQTLRTSKVVQLLPQGAGFPQAPPPPSALLGSSGRPSCLAGQRVPQELGAGAQGSGPGEAKAA